MIAFENLIRINRTLQIFFNQTLIENF